MNINLLTLAITLLVAPIIYGQDKIPQNVVTDSSLNQATPAVQSEPKSKTEQDSKAEQNKSEQSNHSQNSNNEKSAVQNTEKKSEVTPEPELTDSERRELAAAAAAQNDWKKALDLVLPLAIKGDYQSQANIGLLYLQGKGVEKNTDKAYWWLSEAAEKGSLKAINAIALMYFEGEGVKKNIPHAIKLLEISANSDDLRAMNMLGGIYQYEYKDFKKAFKWFEKAAKNGHNEARMKVASMYEKGEGTKRDKNKAISWYKEVLQSSSPLAEEAKQSLERLLR